jgi:hypothetical protein
MKPQDILFILILIFLLWKRNPKYFSIAGLACLLISIPLFHFWIFFTAQRLVWYAFVLLAISTIYLHSEITQKPSKDDDARS